ncbi:hypothetical protein PSACC_00743 [Paramicrosporidium saccamoebae]|uniref:Uncharacterized protein n=1 Tax=Paramicrosporidium saccamoebae TaxID=1246581 RepID=A0A2H9TP05_9FUNG|nr:hypothetical protein PSACC_00743 [Paramicrosporidium saccamoebae]
MILVIFLLLVRRLVTGVLVNFTPRKLLLQHGLSVSEAILWNFSLELENVLKVVALLDYSEFAFYGIYNTRAESLSRIDGLLALDTEESVHSRLFSYPKLLQNPTMAAAFFTTQRLLNVNLMTRSGPLFTDYRDNQKMWENIWKRAAGQLTRITSPRPFESWKRADKVSLDWLFALLLPNNLTPELLELYIRSDCYDLIASYMDKDGQDWMVRNLYVLLTLEKSYSDATGRLTKGHPKTFSIQCRLFRLARKTLQYNNGETFWEDKAALLQDMASERTDVTFWSVFGLLLRRTPVKYVGKLDFFITNTRNIQSPYAIKQTLEAFSEFVNVAQNPWGLDSIYLPLGARPLEERRSEWIKLGPLSMIRKSHCSWTDEAAEFSKALSAKFFPLNLTLYVIDEKDERSERHISEILIGHASLRLRANPFTLPYLEQHVELIVAAIPYLILLRRKLDFEFFFEKDSEWVDFFERVGPKIPELDLLGKFLKWRLMPFFTLGELRQLIDTNKSHL